MNKNHIVRVRNDTMKHAIASVSMQTKATYQECFEELCNMFADGHVLGVNTKEVLFARMTAKFKTPF